MGVMVTTKMVWDDVDDRTMSAKELLEAMWPVYYYGIACNDDNSIAAGCAGDGTIYDHAQAVVKGLLHKLYPDFPVEFMWDLILDCGELLSEDTLRRAWRERLDSERDLSSW